jgi:hypothetical protein
MKAAFTSLNPKAGELFKRFTIALIKFSDLVLWQMANRGKI